MRKVEILASENKHRREILQRLAAGGAGLTTASAAGRALGQPAAQGPSLKVIDFHNHFIGSEFTPIVGAGAPAARRAYFDAVNRNLADSQALLASIESAGITARVINTPLEFIQDPDAETS